MSNATHQAQFALDETTVLLLRKDDVMPQIPSRKMSRRTVLKTLAGLSAGAAALHAATRHASAARAERPNILYVFADQMGAPFMSCAGMEEVRTPNLDEMGRRGIRFTHAVSTYPVCTPHRACLMTGKHPLSTGLITNDIRLGLDETTIAKVLRAHGYETGYIGKWHLDGPDRLGFTPPGPRRQGFDDYWAALDCLHLYLDAFYYTDTDKRISIEGYEPDHQTKLAIDFINREREKPFCLFMSYGPPHGPYHMVPKRLRDMYDPKALKPRPNTEKADPYTIANYYAHITGLDENIGRLLKALDQRGITEDTIFIFSSDHGDSMYSHGTMAKPWPWAESAQVPFIMNYPAAVTAGQVSDLLLGTVDIMPTLLSLCHIPLPGSCEGRDLSQCILGKPAEQPESVFIPAICGQRQGWRGILTKRYTYARRPDEPAWVLYDDQEDPFQMNNLANKPEHKKLQDEMEGILQDHLKATGDDFQPGPAYYERFGITFPEGKPRLYIISPEDRAWLTEVHKKYVDIPGQGPRRRRPKPKPKAAG